MLKQNKILVIEDDIAILDILTRTLKLNKFAVLTAQNGEDGSKLAMSELPDLIICDLMMPIKNGYEVLQEVRSNPQTRLIPFIILTARSDNRDIRKGMNFGADDYLTKPFDLQDLLTSVGNALNKKEEITRQYSKQLNELRLNINSSLPHEIKTPLNVILSHTSSLLGLEDYSNKDNVKLELQSINEAAMRLHRMYDNYLIFSILETNSIDKLRHNIMDTIVLDGDIISNIAIDQLKSYNREDDLIVDAQTAIVDFSAYYFKKVLIEIVDNAAKFSDPGSKIKILGKADAEHYHLTVIDKGRGMSKEQVDEIAPYRQFNREQFEQQGFGLGLYIVKKVMHLVDAKFNIKSSTKGTEITISFNLK